MIHPLQCKFNPILKSFKDRKLSIIVLIDNSAHWALRSNNPCSNPNVDYYNIRNFIKSFNHQIKIFYFVFKDYTLL